MTLVCATFLYFMLKRENKRRDELYGPAPLPSEGHDTSSPEYLKRWGLEGMSHDEIVNLGDNVRYLAADLLSSLTLFRPASGVEVYFVRIWGRTD
jgi:hypothetical protein